MLTSKNFILQVFGLIAESLKKSMIEFSKTFMKKAFNTTDFNKTEVVNMIYIHSSSSLNKVR